MVDSGPIPPTMPNIFMPSILQWTTQCHSRLTCVEQEITKNSVSAAVRAGAADVVTASRIVLPFSDRLLREAEKDQMQKHIAPTGTDFRRQRKGECPLYLAVAGEIERQIRAGILRVGEKVP